jgi:hypothetical protein
LLSAPPPRVAFTVRKAEWIGGAQLFVPRLERGAVEQKAPPAVHAETVMKAARRAHFEFVDQKLGGVGFAAAVALAKNTFSQRLFALRLG